MNIQTAVRAEKAELQRLAREEAYSTPLKDFHPGAPRLFQDDILWPFFERLRKEEPVHYCTNAPIEPYWSVTKYNDIMHVDTNHGMFSSDSTLGGISIRDVPPGYDYPSFIAMDQPRHSAQRKTVSPMFTTSSMRFGRPCCESSVGFTSPSLPGAISTKAPRPMMRVTLPV